MKAPHRGKANNQAESKMAMNDQGRSDNPLDARPPIPGDDSNFYIQALPATPSQSQRRFHTFIRFYLPSLIVVGLAFSAVGYLIAHENAEQNAKKISNSLCLCDAIDMTQTQLKQVVAHNHLRVYWGGPTPGSSVRYRLNALDPTSVVLTVVPETPRVGAEYDQVITYLQKNAFKVVLAAGSQNAGQSSFINVDGNAVFFSDQSPEIVYVGLKGQDFQVKIFSTTPGKSLAIAKEAGRLTIVK